MMRGMRFWQRKSGITPETPLRALSAHGAFKHWPDRGARGNLASPRSNSKFRMRYGYIKLYSTNGLGRNGVLLPSPHAYLRPLELLTNASCTNTSRARSKNTPFCKLRAQYLFFYEARPTLSYAVAEDWTSRAAFLQASSSLSSLG